MRRVIPINKLDTRFRQISKLDIRRVRHIDKLDTRKGQQQMSYFDNLDTRIGNECPFSTS